MVELPLLPPGGALTNRIRPDSDALWPGGVTQRHRVAMRPLAEELLASFGATFLGTIDVGQMGVWSAPSAELTAVGFVADLSFSAFARLARGEYGGAPTRARHTLLLLNPRLSAAANIGQPWERALRREAAALVDEGGWRWVYAARALAQPDGSHLGTLVSTCAHAAGGGHAGGDGSGSGGGVAGEARGGGEAAAASAAASGGTPRLCTSVFSAEGGLVSREYAYSAADLRSPFGRDGVPAARAALARLRGGVGGGDVPPRSVSGGGAQTRSVSGGPFPGGGGAVAGSGEVVGATGRVGGLLVAAAAGGLAAASWPPGASSAPNDPIYVATPASALPAVLQSISPERLPDVVLCSGGMVRQIAAEACGRAAAERMTVAVLYFGVLERGAAPVAGEGAPPTVVAGRHASHVIEVLRRCGMRCEEPETSETRPRHVT